MDYKMSDGVVVESNTKKGGDAFLVEYLKVAAKNKKNKGERKDA